MSSLKKSASFRSRIPVRRTRVPPRRCCSPQPPSTSLNTIDKPYQRNSNNNNNKNGRHQFWTDGRGSSSSYSSSDESHESEAPLQRLLIQSTSQVMPRAITESTDALSLDGLLDSVSSGSFSSPSSPAHFKNKNHNRDELSSYESLEKFNYAVETLKMTDDYDKQKVNTTGNINNKNNNIRNFQNVNLISTGLPVTNEMNDKVMMVVVDENIMGRNHALHSLDTMHTSNEIMPNSNNHDKNQTNEESEKQKKLSDWYYIKTSPKPKHVRSEKLGSHERKKLNNIQNKLIDPNLQYLDEYKNKIEFLKQQHYHHHHLQLQQQQQQLQHQQQQSSSLNMVNNISDDVNNEFVLRNVNQRENYKMNSSRLSIDNHEKFEDIQQFQQIQCSTSTNLQSTSLMSSVKPWNDVILAGNKLTAPIPIPAPVPSNVTIEETANITSPVRQNPDRFIFRRAAAAFATNVNGKTNNNITSNKNSCNSARFGEVNSNSFEHMNIASFLTVPEEDEHTNVMNLANNFVSQERISVKDRQKYQAALCRPLPRLPIDDKVSNDHHFTTVKSERNLFQNFYPPPKTQSTTPATPASYRSDCELSGSYVSLECPSPPGPPACLSESRQDPQTRLGRYLRALYVELSSKEPVIPVWAQPVRPGALCPARLEPDLRLHIQSHGLNECISVDQLLTSIQAKDGPIIEAPRRVLIECPPWATRSSLALRIVNAWAKESPWPQRGTPVALALFIPLSELKGSFSNYIGKELLTKGPHNPFASSFSGFNTAWNTLESLKAKLLIVLDGYDILRSTTKARKGKAAPQDVLDLLEGRLFPESRVIVISVTQHCSDLLPLMQRHVTFEGLTWGRTASLLGGGQWGAPSRLLDTVQECVFLRNAARTPLGCLAISTIFESTGGCLPTDEIDVIESVLNCVASDTSQNNIAELGRLALFCLKMKRSAVTTTEIKMYCSSPDAAILGCLDRGQLFGKSAKKKGEYYFTPVCAGIAEFLAANYLASLANRPGLLAAEVAGLCLGDEVEPEILKVLNFAMGLLGHRAYVLLSKLTPLWLSPQTIFSLALSGGESEANLNALCEILGISKPPPISPLEAKPIWVQIRSTPNELLGWGMALKSSSCTLKNLELAYQMEKNLLLDSRNGMEVFLESLSRNESVTTLRISSLIENDVRESEIIHLANCVAKALLKPRLECFELILTLLEEDPPVSKLQSVVTALCRSIPRQTRLGSLLLDLGLCTSQLVQICQTLEKSSHITRLSLPHLRCERGAIGALATLLTVRPLAFLALPACWGARDDPPSSSGVSMGSGSGSSSGTSGLIKQSSLTGAPSPRSYPPGLFSSLPRGVMPPNTNLGRSATLPRQPLEGPPDKRSSDSVVSKTWYPTPACEGGPHNSGTLHDLLLAARESYSRLHGLDLSKAQLSLEDSMCLGETVRLSPSLHSLKLEGASRLSEVLPALLGAGESNSLQMMSLGSPRLSLEDGSIAMSARALANCSTLRLLSIEGWSFKIENSTTLTALRAFLTFTCVRELCLSNCRLHLPILRSDVIPSEIYECRSVVVLKMAGAQVTLADHVTLRGPQLVPYLGGFPCLRELDLSAPARSGLGSSTSAPLILTDKCIINFAQHLHSNFSLLNTLKMCNWILHLDDATKTLKTISKCFRNSPLSHVKADAISVVDRPKKQRIEPQFLHVLLSSLPQLRWMGISLSGMSDEQITAIGSAVLDLKGHEIDIRLSDSTIEHAKLMTQAVGLDGKFDIRVSTFGTSTGILVHAEKSGTKSLTRKTKE